MNISNSADKAGIVPRSANRPLSAKTPLPSNLLLRNGRYFCQNLERDDGAKSTITYSEHEFASFFIGLIDEKCEVSFFVNKTAAAWMRSVESDNKNSR